MRREEARWVSVPGEISGVSVILTGSKGDSRLKGGRVL
jgi:hypothetical protein